MKVFPFNAICPCHGEIVHPNGGYTFEQLKQIAKELPFNPAYEGHLVCALRANSLDDWIICSLGD